MTAWDDAAASADAAGVAVRTVEGEEVERAIGTWQAVWGAPVIERNLLTALEHAGNYVAVAFAGDQPVGAAAGFFGPPASATLHSHVAGVVGGAAGKGVGVALKLHQRAWCLDRGVTSMTWTYDPLIARNAHFNLARLGARVHEYLVNHYGAMTDGINAGDESDRALARWDLTMPWPPAPPAIPADAVVALADQVGSPSAAEVPADASALIAAIPSDIETLRREQPALGLAWRRALRDVLAPRLDAGWSVTGYSRDHGYLLEAPA